MKEQEIMKTAYKNAEDVSGLLAWNSKTIIYK
jgi:hypothetical protein